VCEEGDGGVSIGDAELYNVVYIHTYRTGCKAMGMGVFFLNFIFEDLVLAYFSGFFKLHGLRHLISHWRDFFFFFFFFFFLYF